MLEISWEQINAISYLSRLLVLLLLLLSDKTFLSLRLMIDCGSKLNQE